MSEWIKWEGEDYCPVDCEAQLNIKFRGLNGDEEKDIYIAGEMRWKHLFKAGDIIAYRLANCALTNDCGKVDMVNSPSHYTSGKVECIDALEAATVNLSGIEAVCTANAIKYLWRWKQKGGKQDLEKAQWYIKHLLERTE